MVWRKMVPAIGGTFCEGAQKFAWNASSVLGSVFGKTSPSWLPGMAMIFPG